MADEPDVKVEEVEVLDEDEGKIPYIYSITAYGADFPVDSLINRLESGDIEIPRFSWTDEEAELVGFLPRVLSRRDGHARGVHRVDTGRPLVVGGGRHPA